MDRFSPNIAENMHFHDSSSTKICDKALRVKSWNRFQFKGNIKINYTILWFQSKGNTLYIYIYIYIFNLWISLYQSVSLSLYFYARPPLSRIVPFRSTLLTLLWPWILSSLPHPPHPQVFSSELFPATAVWNVNWLATILRHWIGHESVKPQDIASNFTHGNDIEDPILTPTPNPRIPY